MLDVTNTFDKDLNVISQKEITDWLMNRKIINNQDVQLILSDKVFNTSGCNNSNELYNKYKDILEEMGISSYVINKVKNDNGDYFVFNVDNIGSITTLGCTDVSNFISINQEKLNLLAPELKESIITNFEKLLSMSVVSEKELINDESIDLKKELANLEKERAELLRRKKLLEDYKKGIKDLVKETKDSKTRTIDNDSFEHRKNKINEKIKEMQSKQQEAIDPKEAFAKSNEQLKEIIYRPGRISIDQEINALQLYNSATAFPNSENIVKALEKASLLPTSSDIKLQLIDTIIKLNERYSINRDEEDLKIVSDAAEKLGINVNTIKQSEIKSLEEELKIIENEEKNRIKSTDKMLRDINVQLLQIEQKISQLTMENKAKVKTMTLDSNIATVVTPVIETATIESSAIDLPKVEETKVEEQVATVEPVVETATIESPAVDLPKVEETKVEEQADTVEPVAETATIESSAVDLPKVEETKVEEQADTVEPVAETNNDEHKIMLKQLKSDNIEKIVTNIPIANTVIDQSKVDNNRPIFHIAPLDKPLEEDYYQRLENAAKEGPIFKDTEQQAIVKPVIKKVNVKPTTEVKENETVIDLPAVEEPKVNDQTEFIQKLESISTENSIFKDIDGIPEEKQHFIKQVKTASINLISKIRNFDFNQKIKDVLAKLKEHKVATTMGLASLLIASGTLLASQLDQANINNESTYVQEVDNNITQDNNAVENNIQYGVEVEQTTEKTEEEMYHEEIEQALEKVMDGAHVHISVDQTLNNDNGRLPTDSQLENSWQNVTPGAYYDQNGNNITLEQAVNNSMNGEETVVRMDNGDVPIGYIDVDQIVEENQVGMSR